MTGVLVLDVLGTGLVRPPAWTGWSLLVVASIPATPRCLPLPQPPKKQPAPAGSVDQELIKSKSDAVLQNSLVRGRGPG